MKSSTLFINSSFPKVLEKNIGPYLAGLWEGDGHIILPSFDDKGVLKNTPCLAITAGNQQLPLFKALKHKLGGWIRYKTKEKAIVWTVTARADLLKVVILINGYLRSPKLYQFNLLIDYLNKVFPSPPFVQYSTVDCSSFSENAWLAGFIDADGGFKIRYTQASMNPQTGRQAKKRMALVFKIEQTKNHKVTGGSFEPLMKNIASFLAVPLKISKHHRVEYWCVEVFSLKCMQILVDYLNIFPLLTTKRNDYEDFSKALYMFLKKEHLTPKGMKTILILKNGMNRKRIFYNWDHLN